MTRFSKLIRDEHDNLVETEVREIKQTHMLRCPHYIMVADHYREDGTCKCDDPDNTVMGEWGYVWDAELKRWNGETDE